MKLPPIFAINLDKDVGRWQRLKRTSDIMGLTMVQRYRAVNGKNMKASEISQRTTWLGRQLQPVGVLGCAMSHISLWKKMVEDDIPVAIILEDDVDLVPDFKEKLKASLLQLCETFPAVKPLFLPSSEWQAGVMKKAVLSRATSSFDVILLGGLGRVHPQGRDSFPALLFSLCAGGQQTLLHKSDSLYRPVRPAGTHAYMLTKSGAEKLLKACPKARFHIDIDAWGQRDVEVLMFNPMLAYQTFDSSTLVDDSTDYVGTAGIVMRQLMRVTGSTQDPFTRQPWRHALAEPLLQLGAASGGPLIRNDQFLVICSGGALIAALSHWMRFRTFSKVVARATVVFAVLVKLLVILLLRSVR